MKIFHSQCKLWGSVQNTLKYEAHFPGKTRRKLAEFIHQTLVSKKDGIILAQDSSKLAHWNQNMDRVTLKYKLSNTHTAHKVTRSFHKQYSLCTTDAQYSTTHVWLICTFLMNFHNFQGGLKAAEPYHSDICHVRRALGGFRGRSGVFGCCRSGSRPVGRYWSPLSAGARPPVAGGAPSRR